MQLKLFKFNDETAIFSETEKVYPNLLRISNQVIGIPYKNRRHSYRDLLESTQPLGIKQLIITAETFFNIITASISKGYDLIDLEFIESIPVENQEIVYYYKNKINEESNVIKRKLLVQNFFSELDWIIRDESIDIKKISIKKNSDNQTDQGATLFNNGILLVEEEEASPALLELLKEVH